MKAGKQGGGINCLGSIIVSFPVAEAKYTTSKVKGGVSSCVLFVDVLVHSSLAPWQDGMAEGHCRAGRQKAERIK